MPAYHSTLNEGQYREICKLALLPLKTKFKGPAPVETKADATDIVDEALNFFKANILFRNYEVKGAADRVLVYLTLYISQCLLKIANRSKGDAEKELTALAIANFSIPGDKNFALSALTGNPANRAEADQVRQYLTQLRQELGVRLVQRVYQFDASKPSKWWMCWSKRKFLNKTLEESS